MTERPAAPLNRPDDPPNLEAVLLGLACGDALGAPVEFKEKAWLERKHGWLTEMVGGGQWAPGEWTDDTAMALCVAEGLLGDPEEPEEAIGRRFLEWSRTAKDVGTTISAALHAYKGDWPSAGRKARQIRGERAASNGSLMRTAPVAMAYPEEETLRRMSARISSMTHWHPHAQSCCDLYCQWVARMLEGENPRNAWREALERARAIPLPEDERSAGSAPPTDGIWERLERVERLEYGDLQPSGYAGKAVECLEAAVWCCLHADSLEHAIARAVNLAGEADTIAAVAGGAAGAIWGEGGLPDRWLEVLHQRERLEATARRLRWLRYHHLAYHVRGLKPFEYSQVEERIYAGRAPLSGRDVEQLKQLGVTDVVDLREPGEWNAQGRMGDQALQAAEILGIQRTWLPVADLGAPEPSVLHSARELVRALRADKSRTLYIHCRAGIERTATVLAAATASLDGVGFTAALERLREGRPTFNPLPNQRSGAKRWLREQA